MSTKTLRKRIALVAVVALGLGGLSTVSASAAPTMSTTVAYDTLTRTQVVGGTVTVVWTIDTSTVNTFVVTGVGSVLSSTTDGTNATHTSPASLSGQVHSGYSSWTDTVGSGGTGTDTIVLTSSVAGTTTITVTPVNASTGVPGTAVSKSITWVAAADVALSDVNTIVTLVKSTANCASTSVQTNDFATAVAGARSSISYRDTAGNRGLYLCVIARDGQGKLLPIGDLTLNVSTSVASFASGGTVTRYIAAGGFSTANTYDNTARIYGDNLAKGAGAVTVSITKGSTTISRSLTLTQYGKISSVTAVQSNYALADAQDGDDYYSNAETGAVVAYLVCKDSNGTTVPGCDYDGDGSTTADSGDTDAMYLVTDSDLIAGTPAFSASSPASVSEAGTLTFSLNQQSAAIDAGATSGLLLTVNNATSTAKNQKMTVTVYLKDASETTPTAKLSVPVVLYRSGSATKVTVTPAATTLLPGAVTTVEVSAVDDAGYPVADGTAVSVVATNGSVVSGGSSALSNGKLSTGKQFTAGNSASSSSVVATVGKIATSATISIDGVVDSSAAVDAAAEATDAANAATDAANAAAEAADAATAAAQDAADAVAALSTSVSEMINALKKQITSLTNLVIKIQKKVKA